MLNYEDLYTNLSSLAKNLQDTAGKITSAAKAVQKFRESGNLTEMKKTLENAKPLVGTLSERIDAVSQEVDSFDTHAYFVSGDFTRQFLEKCAEKGIDVKEGEKGVYELFPFKVRIYGSEDRAEEIWVNGKKEKTFRPEAVVERIRKEREKIYNANFNQGPFLSELVEAYETVCAKEGTRVGTNVSLTKIYKAMTPMARARKEYDQLSFAFDLARLYELGQENWKAPKTGKRYFIGTSRDGKSGIRVLDRNGVESYVAMFRELQTDE